MAAVRPLFVVTGASGSGKTTLLPLLPERLAGQCLVFDTGALTPAAAADAVAAWVAGQAEK